MGSSEEGRFFNLPQQDMGPAASSLARYGFQFDPQRNRYNGFGLSIGWWSVGKLYNIYSGSSRMPVSIVTPRMLPARLVQLEALTVDDYEGFVGH